MTEYETAKLEYLARQADALEAIASMLPDLIEAIKTRPSGGGWRRNSRTDHGYYMTVPDLKDGTIKPGDSFHVVAAKYSVNEEKGRVYFYAPFADPANPERLAYLTSTSMTGDKFSKMFNGWTPDPSGGELSADLHMVVGKDKDDPEKRYSFVVSAKTIDIDTVKFNE